MDLDIHERDINKELCQICGACCRITFKLRDTTTRYRRFLRQIGYEVLPPAEAEKPDCCDKKHDITIDMDYCAKLEIRELGQKKVYRCRIYGSRRYPELCEQFNCVSWAKANDTYRLGNNLLVSAQHALNQLRKTSESLKK